MTDEEAPTEGGDSAASATPTDGSLLRAVLGIGARPPPLTARQLVAGVYEIVERIGAGGMGVVYLARDRQLERNVALKVHRTGPANPSVERLVREAQAIAQLSHPNVVTVYQVGSHDGQPFVAMEYVDGGTARSWRAARPRGWREIVALYVAAGRGLEAAHRADLVHRDFKPDNVLVGADGRARVADFGLAQSTAGASAESSGEGTPAYMAPEQRRGETVDAAADQYAFAVSLWEALTGARPGEPPVAPRRAMPGHVEAALRRALATEPAARWPSMTPLLAELARDPQARRRRFGWAAGGIAAVAAAVVVPLALRDDAAAEPCGDGAAALATVWNPPRRAALIAALGARTGDDVAAGLERYAAGWTAAHRQACRDTRVTRSQSEDMLDRRMQCLFAARAAIDATAAALATPSPEVRAHAVDAVHRLPHLERCGDLAALAQETPLPSDPDVRRRLDEAERLHADVHAAAIDPNRRDRLPSADAALAAARAVGWPPLLARALVTHAQQLALVAREAETIAELREAAALALTAGATHTAAVAYADLATFLAEGEQLGGAEIALLTARALDERAGPGRMQRVLVAGYSVAVAGDRHDDAIALARQLVADTDADPERGMTPVSSRWDLAAVFSAAGRFEEAVVVIDEALVKAVERYGADHAELGHYRGRRATYLLQLGRFDEAIAEAEAALAILETWYGPDAVQLSAVLETLVDAYSRAGRLERVLPTLERALASARRGEDHALTANIENQRTIYLVRTGDLAGAATSADELVATVERTRGRDSSGLVDVLMVRGYIAREQGRLDDSLRDFERALAIGAQIGDQHPALLNLRIEQAKTLMAARRFAAARASMEPQAAAVVARTDVDVMIIVETHVVLAAARHALGDRRGARAAFAAAERAAATQPERPDLRAVLVPPGVSR